MAKLRIILGLCLAVAITTVTWQLMTRYEANKQRDLLLADAESTRDLVLHDLRLRVQAIDRMAVRMASFDRFDQDMFLLEARRYLRDMPGFFAIGWVDTNGVLTAVEPEFSQRLLGKRVADFGADRKQLMDFAARSTSFELSPPIKLKGSQNTGFLGAKAVRRGVNQIGTIWVVFRSKDWIQDLHFGLRHQDMRAKPMSIYLNGKGVFVSDGFKVSDGDIIAAPPLRFGGDEVEVHIKTFEGNMTGGKYPITWIVTVLVGVLSITSLIAVLALRSSRLLEHRAALANTALTDTNAQMKMEVAHRRRAEIEAKRSSAAKSQFLSTMSHELRTPMNGVLGMTELLLASGLTDQQRIYADDIGRSGKRLMTVLSDILDFSKLDRGAVALQPEPVKVHDLMASVVQLFAPLAEKKGLSLSLDIAPEVPAVAVVDRAKTRQIVIHLIRNAIKFTSEGEISVYVSTFAEGGPRLRFVVKDTGVGIPDSKLSEIFSEFRQADEDTARQYEGAGLGLSIVEGLAKKMDGHALVTSQIGEGSEFTICLPLVLPGEDAANASTAPKEDAKHSRLQSARVLVVEDNLTNQRIVAAFLKGAGCVLDMANDGQEAIDLFEAGSYDAVLMDVSMPNKNGYEATRSIRALEQAQAATSCPIIGFTANCGDEDQLKCREAGMDDVLSKPASKKELSARLEHWLARGSQFRFGPSCVA